MCGVAVKWMSEMGKGKGAGGGIVGDPLRCPWCRKGWMLLELAIRLRGWLLTPEITTIDQKLHTCFILSWNSPSVWHHETRTVAQIRNNVGVSAGGSQISLTLVSPSSYEFVHKPRRPGLLLPKRHGASPACLQCERRGRGRVGPAPVRWGCHGEGVQTALTE